MRDLRYRDLKYRDIDKSRYACDVLFINLKNPPSPLLAVPNVGAHPLTASAPITVLKLSGLAVDSSWPNSVKQTSRCSFQMDWYARLQLLRTLAF